MVQFLAPLWLLALPAVALPWLWPMLRPNARRPLPFAAFFLLPPERLRRQLRFSRDDFWLKVLRSLLVLLLILLLARPFWLEEQPPTEIWLIDDTASAFTAQLPRNVAPVGATVLTFSELFAEPDQAPQETQFTADYFAGTPNLGELGQAVLRRFQNEEKDARFVVHLVSEFQRSQFWPYAPVAAPIRWEFYRPDNIQTLENLALRDVEIQTEGKLQAMLHFVLFGDLPSTNVRVRVTQAENLLLDQALVWDGASQPYHLPLNKSYRHHAPLKIVIEPQLTDAAFDNMYYYQSGQLEDVRVGIISTEGSSAIYRYGLHPLKSGLNANGFYSTLVSANAAIAEIDPDLLILLADDPERFRPAEPTTPPRLFIPTRLADWEALRSDNTSAFPATQTVLNWSTASFATAWQVQPNIPGLHYAQTPNLWLLDTGLSNEWGPLYQQQDFVDRLRHWTEHLLQTHQVQHLGTESSNAQNGWLQPGHYQQTNNDRETQYSINLSIRESLSPRLTDAELAQMQDFFDQQQNARTQEQSAGDTLQDWLRWALLGLLLIELLWMLQRTRYAAP
jgi:hypothetical protein